MIIEMRNFRTYFNALFLAVILTFLLLNKSNAQSNWEGGLRFGETLAIEATIPLSAAPRLHPALYIDNAVALGAYFDWMFILEGSPTGLKFYPGVGPELYFGNEAELGIAGNFGVEYSFDFPLTIGFDWRPGFIVTENMYFHSGNWGFTVRYRFSDGVKFVKSK